MNKGKIAKALANAVVSYSKKIGDSEVLETVGGLIEKAGKINEASVIVPKKLDKTEKVKTMKLISRLTGEKVRGVNFYEDKSLLDGMRIFYKDKLWDFSLQTQIDSLISP